MLFIRNIKLVLISLLVVFISSNAMSAKEANITMPSEFRNWLASFEKSAFANKIADCIIVFNFRSNVLKLISEGLKDEGLKRTYYDRARSAHKVKTAILEQIDPRSFKKVDSFAKLREISARVMPLIEVYRKAHAAQIKKMKKLGDVYSYVKPRSKHCARYNVHKRIIALKIEAIDTEINRSRRTIKDIDTFLRRIE